MADLASLRLDKWLWHARFAKSRSLAQKMVVAGQVRINRVAVKAPAHPVRADDVLTVAVASSVRVVKVVGLGGRRGPAPEARLLYEDMTPMAVPAQCLEPAVTLPGPGRPSKRERRAIVAFKTRAPDEA